MPLCGKFFIFLLTNWRRACCDWLGCLVAWSGDGRHASLHPHYTRTSGLKLFSFLLLLLLLLTAVA
jgi:hypothetical protein